MSYSNPNWYENFLKVRKEGELMCCWCYTVFTHDGHPMKTSWCCSKWCFDRHKNEFRDSISRLYLIMPTQFAERENEIAKEEETIE